MTIHRVVLDTNVLVSALLFNAGTLTWFRDAWQSRQIVPLASRSPTAELIRVLAYPRFGLTQDEREDLLADYLPWCETVAMPDPPPEVPTCRAPFDRPFLELAVAGGADALVTGDRDLLALTDSFTVRILAPATFRQCLFVQD